MTTCLGMSCSFGLLCMSFMNVNQFSVRNLLFLWVASICYLVVASICYLVFKVVAKLTYIVAIIDGHVTVKLPHIVRL